MKGRVVNVPGTIRAKEIGNGVCELVKEPDVLCIVPAQKKRIGRKVVFAAGTFVLFAGMIITMICLAPALGTIVFGLVAWCAFAASATEKE